MLSLSAEELQVIMPLQSWSNEMTLQGLVGEKEVASGEILIKAEVSPMRYSYYACAVMR